MLVNGIELYVNENIVKNYKATIIITHGLAVSEKTLYEYYKIDD